MSDITRLKELENQNQKKRMIFFSSVAHELRTPLNSILPMSERLKRYISDPWGLKILSILTSSTKHLHHVIEDALDLARIENQTFEIILQEFNLRETVDSVIESLNFQAEQKNLLLIVEIAENTPEMVYSDSKRFC